MEPAQNSRIGPESSKPTAVLGSVVLLLRSNAYELRIPRLFGVYDLVCDPSSLPGKESSEGVPEAFVPSFNVLDAVVGLPTQVRSDLGQEECEGILGRFRTGDAALRSLEAAHGRPWVRETQADMRESTAQILAPTPHFGESKWASLLGAERALKAFLVTRGQRASHTHQLLDLAENASAHGLVGIPLAWIAQVQCSRRVRDGETEVALEEAVRAQECSLKIIQHAVAGIPKPTE